MEINGRFRKKRISFTQVSNIALSREGGLSLRGRGLYATIQKFITIPNFTLYKNMLLREVEEGKKAFESTWKELKQKGFLIQYRMQKPDGKFYYEYELLDEPDQNLINESSKNNNSKVQKQIETDNKKDNKNDKNHIPLLGGPDKGDTGKGGLYNNTNLNNTNLNNTNLNKKKKKEDVKTYKGYKLIIEKYTNNKDLQDTIYKFIQTRKANRAMTTDAALEILLNKLDTLAENDLDKIDRLNNSIINAYKDLYPAKEVIKKQNMNFDNSANNNNNNKKDLKFKNFDERQYNYDDLEKKLLGWEE